MSVAVELLSLKNPSHILSNKASFSTTPPLALRSPPSLRLQQLVKHHHVCCRVSASTRTVVSPLGLGNAFRSLRHPSTVAFAASHEDSRPEIKVDKEQSEDGSEGGESEEAWKQALASFKETALKMQSVSQQAYEEYSVKAVVVLKETAENLRIQTDKFKEDLNSILKDISKATEESPEDLKEIVEAFSSADDLGDISKASDFHVGIPYGSLLVLGGFLSFMLTGSIPAIRFGVILGGALLLLSILSLKSQTRQVSRPWAVKGQAVIAAIIFLREVRLLSESSTLMSLLNTIISGAVVAFYVYRIADDGKKTRGPNLERGADN